MVICEYMYLALCTADHVARTGGRRAASFVRQTFGILLYNPAQKKKKVLIAFGIVCLSELAANSYNNYECRQQLNKKAFRST